MIQIIGLMIGLYILTRMVELLTHLTPTPKTAAVALLAVLTAVGAIAGIILLFTTPAPAALR